MTLKKYSITRLIKLEDLNHHGTLFAGRMAEWFVEGTFIASAGTFGNPNNIVCLKLHGLKFTTPVNKGEMITLETQVVYAGTTSLTAYGCVRKDNIEKIIVEGFATFVTVDDKGNKIPHGIILPEPCNEREQMLRNMAKSLK